MNYIKIKDVTDFVRNGASIKQPKQCSTGIPITRIETVSNSVFNWDKLGFADITDDKYKDYYLKDKDVLLSHINSAKFLGRSVLFEAKDNNPIIHGMNLLCLRFIQSKYNPKFFVWYSNSRIAKNYFEENTKKAVNQASITSTAIKEMPIPELSLTEQQKIAAHLDSIQSAIDNKKQQLSELDELVKSKFVEMFGENPVESGKWKVETLGLKSELITKGASPRWQGVEYQSEGTLFVTSENVREGYVDLTKSKFLPDEINEILPRSVLKKNDVLINIVGASIGRAAIYEFEQKANINQAVALVRLNSSDLDKTFLLIYLNSELAMKLYQSMIKGGARDNLSLKNISDLSIPVPPIELQNTFAEYVQKIDSAKSIIKTQLVDLQELLDSKMDEYFGE